MSGDDFLFKPPQYSGQQSGFIPPNAHAAWMLQLIKIKLENTNLPEEIKTDLLVDMMPYLDNASMTKITKGQVREFLGGYNELWLRYRIFKCKKKYTPQLNYVMAYIRELLVMNLNKSVMGWQGDHVFEQKTTYDVRQTRKDLTEKLRNLLGGKKKQQNVEEVYE
jgi:hypothetical protein